MLSLLLGLLNIECIADDYSVTCTQTSPPSDQRVQGEILDQLCQHSISLAKRFKGSNPRVVLRHKERWQQLPYCPVALDIRFSAMAQNGKVPLLISCSEHDGTPEQRWKQRLAIGVDFDVAVLLADRDISRGEALSGTGLPGPTKSPGLKKSKVPFSAMKPNVFQDNVSGYITTRKISAGSVITTDMVKKASAIRRGQQVTIAVQLKNIELTTTGVAMENGYVGDIILVQKENGRPVKCRVINEDEVRPVGGERRS
ncbi:flagellar basal body P-ring formation chaperone FlgA [Endozoicomonas sp. SCSIO W0465]|uniref:flagellar basal body P-ring formation chaperone FlgA n=1 Tax=Endozoicomonas sp. SCSIO W0465 TaxID=2918516 RepID=UPI002074D7EE|nr:flagellar basal body P-ring formation chaperone FlgA [Endozoicomonas sp. SCSIO W0465]USE38263.1 flagellar basal body P-ring formation chaperone FlgA [Endozoicomonas sp. SCSIO W0465]